MTAVLVVIDDYLESYSGHPQQEQIRDVFAVHLGAHVTSRVARTPPPRTLVLTVTGAEPADVERAAELYLGSAGIAYRTDVAA